MVHPVQRLGASARDAFRTHLLALGPEDRRLRFGTPLADDAIARYVDAIDLDHDEVFGVYGDDLSLVGAAHLGTSGDLAEIGVSVLPEHRGRGIGAALFQRVVQHARNRAHQRLFMHCLSENATMMRMAQRAGMRVVVDHGEADAFLMLAPPTPASITSEVLSDRFALFDYALKSEVEMWRRMNSALRDEER